MFCLRKILLLIAVASLGMSAHSMKTGSAPAEAIKRAQGQFLRALQTLDQAEDPQAALSEFRFSTIAIFGALRPEQAAACLVGARKRMTPETFASLAQLFGVGNPDNLIRSLTGHSGEEETE